MATEDQTEPNVTKRSLAIDLLVENGYLGEPEQQRP